MQRYPQTQDYYGESTGYRHDPSRESQEISRNTGSLNDRFGDLHLTAHYHSTRGEHPSMPGNPHQFSPPRGQDGIQGTFQYDNMDSGYASPKDRYQGKRRGTNYMDNVGSYYHSTHGENHGKRETNHHTDDKPVPHPKPNHKRSTGKKELREQLFRQALQPFKTDTGTPYPCSQAEIDFHQKNVFPTRNKGPFVTSREATKEVMWQNDTKRITPILFEKEAIKRLFWAASCAQDGLTLGPDVAIKAFADLDLVFFAGRLRNHVTVQWQADIGTPNPVWGICSRPRHGEEGQCRIKLNASLIFKEGWTQGTRNPFESMIGTLLHEMSHAYEDVRSPHDIEPGDGGHGKLFETRIAVVHKRALQILGLWAIERGEPYKQYYFFMPGCLDGRRDPHGKEKYKARSPVDGGRKDTSGKKESNGKSSGSGKRSEALKKDSGKKVGKPKRQHKGSDWQGGADCLVM